MFKFNIIAKHTEEGVANSVNILNNGKNYTLYFRITILGLKINWTAIPFVDIFPE